MERRQHGRAQETVGTPLRNLRNEKVRGSNPLSSTHPKPALTWADTQEGGFRRSCSSVGTVSGKTYPRLDGRRVDAPGQPPDQEILASAGRR
jgi:hypothetical protein